MSTKPAALDKERKIIWVDNLTHNIWWTRHNEWRIVHHSQWNLRLDITESGVCGVWGCTCSWVSAAPHTFFDSQRRATMLSGRGWVHDDTDRRNLFFNFWSTSALFHHYRMDWEGWHGNSWCDATSIYNISAKKKNEGFHMTEISHCNHWVMLFSAAS